MKSLLGLTPEEIQELIQAKERFRSRQIYHALYTGIESFDAITDLPLAMREQLSENFSIFTSKIDTSLDDEESNCKLRIELSDGLFTECVILSDGTDRKTICISSQVGCKMGCAFCRTADMGFKRNLTSGEILEQFLMGQKLAGKLSNIVFMGMGEPFDNIDNLLKAIQILNDKNAVGLGARRMTISTCGVVPGIQMLAKSPLEIRLAVSLNSAIEEKRRQIMPITARYPLSELKSALKEFQKDKNKRFTNDPSQAAQANEYNWTTWYQHNEEYTLTLTNSNGGIRISFEKLLINNDELSFYEGDVVSPTALIGTYTCTEYSSSLCSASNPLVIESHGNMTIRFTSDWHWRDEGWVATVDKIATADYTPQPPVALLAACSNQMKLIPTCKGTNFIYQYKIGDTGTWQNYTVGAWVELTTGSSGQVNQTIYTRTLVDTNPAAYSAEKPHTFNEIKAPGQPTYTVNASSNSVTAYFPNKDTWADTYYIRWIINNNSDGGDPRQWSNYQEFQQPNNTPNTVPAGVIDYTNTGLSTPFYIHMATRGTTCPDIFSELSSVPVTQLYVPKPIITFVTNSNNKGATTITCSLDGAAIYYTLDGSTPDPNNVGGTDPTTLYNPGSSVFVDPGTTVKAIAVKTGYTNSAIASEIFIPGAENGNGQNGVYDNIVLLDDREDHSWSYYSDSLQPIYSLNPADIKITYKGFGKKTMTTDNTDANNIPNADFKAEVTASQVKVNVDENGNEFIYLKTLENVDPKGNEINYPYTMIPNPFQVRPTYTGSKSEGDGNISSPIISNEVRDRNGNVVAQTNGTNTTPNIASTIRPTEPTRGSNTLLTAGFENNTTSATINTTNYSATGWYAYNANSDGGNWSRNNGNANSGSYKARAAAVRRYAEDCYLVSAPFTVSANMTRIDVSLYESVSSSSYTQTFEVFFVKASDFNTAAGVVSATHYPAIVSANYTNENYAEKTGYVTNSALAGQSVRLVVHCTSPATSSYTTRYLYIDDITVTETTLNTVTAVAGTGISTAYVAAGDSFSGTSTTVTVPNNSSVTFQATYSDGFIFDGWYNQNNTRVSTDLTYTCSVTNDLTLTAKGIPTYTVTAVAGTGINTAYVAAGTSFSGTNTSVTVTEGGSATFQATYPNGYGFAGWYDELNNLVSTNSTYTANTIMGSFSLTAKAGPVYTVTFAPMNNGSVTANPANAVVGSTVTLTATPASGYELSNITVTGNNSNTNIDLEGTGNTRTFIMPNEGVTVNATFLDPSAKYRGFYAWRVKSLSSGLKIRVGGETGTTYSSSNIASGIILYADQEIEFITDNPYNNEVEFEALWAKAYIVTSNTATGLNANVSYERNFVVGATSLSNIGVPATYSSYYPDGVFRSNSSGNAFTCGADTKFENMTLSGGTLNTGGHKLSVGHGVSTSGNPGITPLSGTFTAAANAILRIERGTYGTTNLYGTPSVGSNLVHLTLILGSDYDRAKGTNTLLTISQGSQISHGAHTATGSSWMSFQHLDIFVKSGTIQKNFFTQSSADYRYTFYCRPTLSAANRYPGITYLTVEGGEFASINGGRGNNVAGVAMNDDIVFSLRMKGGTVHGSIYGAASANPSFGGRRFVFTGGMVEGWIAGGCDGTSSGGGQTIGDSYFYVGGKAQIGNSANPRTLDGTVGGNIFGAGRGTSTQGTDANPASMRNSYIVVADSASVLHNVYGGGEYGYTGCNSENGGTDPNTSANIYIIGGTVQGSVHGGGNNTKGTNTNINMTGGTVQGNLYGGSNNTGTIQNLATVNFSGGTVTNVFGGGYGNTTVMAGGTKVNVSGGTINNNVYGGGEEGTVGTTTTHANTVVSVSGGTMLNVYGAGKGNATSNPVRTADINGTTTVSISGGTMDNVYGGGEAGNVVNGTNLASTVTIQGGTINEDVFGGGRLGKTTGNVIVNMFDGSVTGNIYGGAFGKRNEVYIAGTHTVNMTGGIVYTNVYGGSRNADDALSFTTSTGASETVSRVNISGGHVYYQVFASGYFGHTYGSVYAYIGQNAILLAPNAAPTTNVGYSSASLIIDGSVWAGADFGNFDGYSFGEATIEGYSNVYIDGTDYNTTSTKPTDAGYMNIGSSVLGSGTSCYAGKLGSNLIIRKYGRPVENPNYSKEAIVEPYTSATRNLMSIQFFKTVVIDDTHMQLIGQGRINSLVNTEKYSIYGVDDIVRMVNGSSVFIDYPTDQMKRLGSFYCANVYASSPYYDTISYNATGNADYNLDKTGMDNKFRVNNGSFLNIKYVGAYNPTSTQTGYDYGELIGYFYIMTDDENRTCAYARPKQSSDNGNQIPTQYDNPLDGGFRSYDKTQNSFSPGRLNGSNQFAQIADAPGTATTSIDSVQMPYENHTLDTKNGEQYFRIWRYGDKFSYRQGVFNAVATTTAGYSTTDVVISLPASSGANSYFRIKKENNAPMIDYGDDVMTVNAGAYGDPTGNNWMTYNAADDRFVIGQDSISLRENLKPLTQNPNVNFGLVAIPQGSLDGGTNETWLFCSEAGDEGEILSSATWANVDITKNPSILFRLTYNNELTNNATWDPIIITFEQVQVKTENGVTTETVTDEIQIALSVSTVTTINQDFGGQTWAMMNKQGSQADTYTAKIVLPGFIPFVNTEGDLSDWTFKSAVWIPNTENNTIHDFDNAWKQGSGYVHETEPYANNEFSMEIVPSSNFDNTVGWNSYDHTPKDLLYLQGTAANDEVRHLAYTDGRNPAAFNFILHFDGRALCNESKKKMGELKVTLHFTNIKNGTINEHEQDLDITIEVYRRGQGANYYLDGVNGNNSFDGSYPNSAKKTLSGIFNRTEYTPGDNIFIVNTVTANGATTLDWNGEMYGQVILYRYPGGHTLHEITSTTTANEAFLGYNTYNPDNKGFAGTLVKVSKGMDMHGIVLDGAYDIVHASPLNAQLVPDANKYQDPTAPLVEIESNGVLTVYSGSKLQWNYTKSDGGAVYNAGRLNIRDGSQIINNKLLAGDKTYLGGGVYVKEGAKLVVSDDIRINNNYRVVGGADKNSNVYLDGDNSVIQVGTINPTDGFDALSNTAKVGVSKGSWPDNCSYNPIAYSDGGGSAYLGNLIPSNPDATPAANYIIFDDDDYYKVVTLNNTPGYEPSKDYLFWVGTWVTAVRTKPDTYIVPAYPATTPVNITTAEDLAWAISVVNGLNGQTAAPSTKFNVTADIDMSANIWVPIGISTGAYTGTFNANGHVIKGVKSSLNDENMGMFGVIDGKATIENMILNVNFSGGNSVKMGSVAALMNNGTIRNVETAGTITGTSVTTTMGGVVGQKGAGIVHSSFAVNTLIASNDDTYVGGLVGDNSADLVNCYANTTMGEKGKRGGLVGVNNGHIENCYAVVGKPDPAFPAFAYDNNSTILYCYADEDHGYVDGGTGTITGHGKFSEPKDRKEIGYMYYDNGVTLDQLAGSNDYVSEQIEYAKEGTGENTIHTRIERWNGLLSALNWWVSDNTGLTVYTPWFRPTSPNINGDLPVLAFPKDNCLGTTDADGKYLVYGSTVGGANGLDNLLATFNEKTDASSLFLYGNATNVANVPASQVKVFVNEDACLIQSSTNKFINTTVGITFDNSFGQAHAYPYYPFGGTAQELSYDWHMMSTPLMDAKIGASYSKKDADGNYIPDACTETVTVIFQESDADIASLTDSYFPNDLVGQNTVKWDFYSFYEPEYHWINLKRNKKNHFHRESIEFEVQDKPYQMDEWGGGYRHYQLEYDGDDQADKQANDGDCVFTPGKGYMMAISQDSYMSSTGTLNNGPVTIPLTHESEQPDEYGFNLLGNPYQAYLQMSAFLDRDANPGLGTSYWVYVAEYENYAAGNLDGSTNWTTPSGTLHPHQAFFVWTKEADEARFMSSTMITDTLKNYSYFRGKIDYPLVNLFATNERGQKDLTVIEVNRPEFGGSPKLRAMNNTGFELFARNNGNDYSILFTEEGTDRVAVAFKTTEDGTYNLSWDTQNGQFSYLQLIDNLTGAQYDMLANDHYSFEAHPTDMTTRFYVVFKVAGNNEEGNGNFAFFNGNEWVVDGKGTLQVVDVTGRVLYSKSLSGNTTTRVQLDNLAAGVYMLHLVNRNGESKTQKIVID